jgi:hypothetical protein
MLSRHDHILRRSQPVAMGATVSVESPLTLRMAARVRPEQHRALCGDQTPGVVLTLRRPLGLPDMPNPAPLLMRLMRRKTTLTEGAWSKAVVREAREARSAPVDVAAEVAGAMLDHHITRLDPIPHGAGLEIPEFGMIAARRGVVGVGA